MSMVVALLMACLLAPVPARAADPPPFTAAQLDQMLASIALFPDALLSQVLMASTYPSDVALAVDWAFANRQLKGDAAVKAVQDKPWDPSVQSLVAFPQVLAMFGENPQWVHDLGDAFLGQPADVMDSVQFLRAKAKDAGNLVSNEQQVITIEPAPPPPQVIVVNAPPPPAQIIVIAPANPQVVFVPIFNPFWAFGPWWHPAFPPFFFPPPPRWGWGWSSAARAGFWWGVGIGVSYSLWGGVDWRRRDVNINVNNWNNINVNRRIDSRDRNVQWRHDAGNRRGVPYRDAATRDRLQQRAGDARTREEYRGRELQRDRARQELSDRVGAQNLDRTALRDIDRSQLPQRPVAGVPGGTGGAGNVGGNARDRAAAVDRAQVQNRVANADRSQVQNRVSNVDRAQAQDRVANVDRSQVQDRAENIDRTQLQNRAASVDRSQAQSRAAAVDRAQVQERAAGFDRSPQPNRQTSAASINRDNALLGAGNAAQTRQQIDRGAASQASMDQQISRGAVQQGAMDRQRGSGDGAAAGRRRSP
jgi:hypothetical protein